jgi:hypothetical protein
MRQFTGLTRFAIAVPLALVVVACGGAATSSPATSAPAEETAAPASASPEAIIPTLVKPGVALTLTDGAPFASVTTDGNGQADVALMTKMAEPRPRSRDHRQGLRHDHPVDRRRPRGRRLRLDR